MDRSDGNLSGMVGGATLDGEGDDLLRGLVAFGTNLLFGLTDDGGSLMGDLTANLVLALRMANTAAAAPIRRPTIPKTNSMLCSPL